MNENSTTNAQPREVFTSLTISAFRPRKEIKLPVSGTFTARVTQVVVLGQMLYRFQDKDTKTYNYLDYVSLGFTFSYTDKNTGEINEIHVRTVLSDVEGGRLHSLAVATGKESDLNVPDFLDETVQISVKHNIRGGKTFADVESIEATTEDSGIATDASVYLNVDNEWNPDTPTDQQKLLSPKWVWWISKRSQQHGSEPMTQALFEKHDAEREAKAVAENQATATVAA